MKEFLIPVIEKLIGEHFTVKSIDTCNHKPHPFTVGPRHIEHAAKFHGHILGDETMEAIPCAARDCGKPLHEHTYDTVLFVSLKHDLTNEVASATIQPVGKILEENGIDGMAFVESGFKFTKG